MTGVEGPSSRLGLVLAAMALLGICTGATPPEPALTRIDTSTPRQVVPTPTRTSTSLSSPPEMSTPITPEPTVPRGLSRALGIQADSPIGRPSARSQASTKSRADSLPTVTTSRAQTSMPTPRPAAVTVKVPLLPPEDEATTWRLPGFPHIAAMRDTIVTVLRTNELEFGLDYPVRGFSPDPIYPRIFIRDLSTLMAGASYFYPADRLRWSVEAFLRQQYEETTVSSEDSWQAGFGAISATVGPDGAVDKATAVSDEDTHLIHAAYQIYHVVGGAEWLRGEINGMPVIDRLNAVGDWLLNRRRDEGTGLIRRDHTTDWGDVRFQPTDGNPTDMVADDVVWTASIYDQALAYRAWRELATMNEAVGDLAAARRWEAEADALRHATNTHLWQPERGFFRTHLHLAPLAHDFDEGAMVSIANAVAIVCGLTDASQDAAILAALENARLGAGAAKAGLVLYPHYPHGFFASPFMGPGEYQNGGVWDWWGGWQVLAEFESGYSQIARAHILQTATDWAMHPGRIFEWQQVSTMAGQGGDQYAGAAGVYSQVIVEGLYGVGLSLAGPTLSPRLGEWAGEITVRQSANGFYLRYSYQPSVEGLALAYETNHHARTFPLRLLLPPDFTPGRVHLDGVPLVWQELAIGQDAYLSAILPTGGHFLAVEVDQAWDYN